MPHLKTPRWGVLRELVAPQNARDKVGLINVHVHPTNVYQASLLRLDSSLGLRRFWSAALLSGTMVVGSVAMMASSAWSSAPLRTAPRLTL